MPTVAHTFLLLSGGRCRFAAPFFGSSEWAVDFGRLVWWLRTRVPRELGAMLLQRQMSGLDVGEMVLACRDYRGDGEFGCFPASRLGESESSLFGEAYR